MLSQSLRRRFASSRLYAFLSILGPGLIAANADNDASGIYGYALAGAQYRYAMLWVLVLSTIALGVAQEICARMGAVTGKGLAELIREEYGVRITLFAMLALLVANFATTVSEFAGILAAVQLFAGPTARFWVLPLVAGVVWLLVARGSYRRLERILLGASLIYLLYIVTAFLARPDWGQVLKETFVPNLKAVSPLKDYVFMVINVVGTTITPWGQFYIQSSVRDKGIKASEYSHTRLDVLFGAFFTNFVAYFIIVCCGATLYAAGIHQVNDAGQVAKALAPLAGSLATVLFAVGLFNASCFGAIAVPLSTAYAVTEALGWESGLGRRTREAPLFIGTFTFLIIMAALLVMFFPAHLAALIILPNIVGAVLLPIILVLMLLLVNSRRLMDGFTNSRTYNAIAWTTTVVLIVLSLILLVTNLIPAGH
ncbi:MAG TPA: divalent metal cation transporter [Chthonomonadaceae bacterium]|nr:divalent metal cation transporter [Chthonomonadaceae bacterium]